MMSCLKDNKTTKVDEDEELSLCGVELPRQSSIARLPLHQKNSKQIM